MQERLQRSKEEKKLSFLASPVSPRGQPRDCGERERERRKNFFGDGENPRMTNLQSGEKGKKKNGGGRESGMGDKGKRERRGESVGFAWWEGKERIMAAVTLGW